MTDFKSWMVTHKNSCLKYKEQTIMISSKDVHSLVNTDLPLLGIPFCDVIKIDLISPRGE